MDVEGQGIGPPVTHLNSQPTSLQLSFISYRKHCIWIIETCDMLLKYRI